MTLQAVKLEEESAMTNPPASRRINRLLLALTCAVFAWQAAHAATTDIASAPIFTTVTATTEVKPNVMFVLDDSGSMDWDYMPDNGNSPYFSTSKYGYASSQCNGVYYNPAITYAPPVDASGASYPNSTFSDAWMDGYNTASTGATNRGTVDLGSKFALSLSQSDAAPTSGTAAYYYRYTGAQTSSGQKSYYSSSSTFYKECNSSIGSTPGSSVFTKVTVGAGEQQNFANWFSYYRTRINMMKSAAGQAFKTMGNHFRVGISTINNRSTAFLDIADFDSTQKSSWYDKLYGVNPGNSTPLREALANVGRMYAGMKPNLGATSGDPVQYACQQNYTILSTDGFWNGTDSNVKKINGTTTMDNQDGALARPYYDGATMSYNRSTSQLQSSQTRTTESTSQLQKRTTQIQKRTTQLQQRSVLTKSVSGQLYKGTSSDYGDNWTWSSVSTCSEDLSGRNQTQCVVGVLQTQTSGDYGGSWTSWTNTNSCTTDYSGRSQTDCRTSQSWTTVASCTPTRSGSSGSYTYTGGASAVDCMVTASGWSNVSSCSASATVECQTTDTGWVNASSCSGSSSGGQTVTCQTTDTGWVGAGSCTAGSSGGQTVDCQTVTAGPTTVATCTAQVAGSGNNWLQRTCATTVVTAATGVETCTAVAPTAENSFVATNCTTVTTGPTSVTSCTPATASAANNWTTTTCSTGTTSGGTSDTLADVAAYYYNTNLRSTAGKCTGPIIPPATTATNLCLWPNTLVPANGQDTATWPHMTTFTLGLGARGRMVFSSTYLTDTTGDYFDVWKGNTAGASNCSWQNADGKPCNWPIPGSDQIENIDDLWHAAVNGHGNYFSATDPSTLTTALSSSLNVIINTPQPGTAASAATTNPKITSANNFQFSSYFKSVEWSGELIRQTMSLTDGSVPYFDPLNPNPSAYDWSAQVRLDATAYGSRNIYTKGTLGLIAFTWASLNTAGLQSYFTTPHISTSPPGYPTQLTGLSQFCAAGGPDCIDTTAQSANTIATGGAAGEALVNFLRGDISNQEGAVTDPLKFFRNRTHVLGDIVSAQPQYVGPPNKTYADDNYSAFVSAKASRLAIVYAAANDGMLHAFDAGTGDEKWAYIPSFVLPRLYTLADKKYSDKHQYFVEGTPSWGDICPSAPATVCTASQWKTILVGGLNGGGTGYYALDITNPTSPALLWEYTDADMGYSFGNPQITKMDDGTWVVLLTSGYDNCPHSASAVQCVKNGSGDGNGYLYVLNAGTGALIQKISTGVGSTGTPSGLSRIIAQAGATNVTERVYGGDLLGNLWRFSIGSGGYSAHLLASFKDAAGIAQPIMAKPQVTTYNGKPIVYVGTGRYLGTTDVGTTQQQTFYAVKDPLDSTTYSALRSNSGFISKTAVDGICPAGSDTEICQPGTKVRTVIQNGGLSSDSLSNKTGWYVDFPASSGELEFTDPKLTHGTLSFSTSVPTATTSAVCGSSASSDPVAFGYMLDWLNGGAVSSPGNVIARSLGTGVATTPQIAQLPNGTVIAKYRLSSGQEVSDVLRFGSGANPTRRVSWRELISE
jgi:type IV pilus assembly protein PilY1